MMEFLSITEESLEQAAACLRGGGLVAFPTETVYGLGADTFNLAALAKVFEAKGRPRFDPLIIHIAALETLAKLADLSLLNEASKKNLALLAENFWPGPLTLILPRQKAVPGLATSGLPTVAVRFPCHPAAQRLIALSGGAVAAPSANPFGYLSPTRAEHVRDQLGEKVDIILDGGLTKLGVESTVLDISGKRPRLFRPGGVPVEKIESLIGLVDSAGEVAGNAGMVSPGLLKSHYAPRTIISVYSRDCIIALSRKAGETADSAFLFFDGSTRNAWLSGHGEAGVPIWALPDRGEAMPLIKTLSERGDLLEAAANLFGFLHELDRAEISQIHAQLAPEQGLGAAINDRLKRASAR
jgi:L-threonylcarbamoyladenylate synthase